MSEVARLKVTDIDSQRMTIRITRWPRGDRYWGASLRSCKMQQVALHLVHGDRIGWAAVVSRQ